jgi:WD40 repeat protein
VSRAEHGRLRGHPVRVHAVAFLPTAAPDRPLLASAGCAGSVHLPGVLERVDLRRHNRAASAAVSAVALSPDGRTLVSGGHDGAAVVWDLSALAAPRVVRELRAHKGAVRAVALDSDERGAARRAATGGRDRTVRVWDLRAPDAPPRVLEHDAVVTSLVFLPDGRTLVSAGDGRTVRLWDARGGQKLAELGGHSGPVTSLALRPDGRLLASAGERPDAKGHMASEVLLWELPAGRLVGRLEDPDGVEDVRGVAFSPDGQTLASGHLGAGARTGVVRLWDVAGRNLRTSWKVEAGGVRALAFAPDGRSLVTACCRDVDVPSVVQFWDEWGEERLRLRGGAKQIRGLSFATAHGRRLAAAGFDGTAVVWEGAARREGD